MKSLKSSALKSLIYILIFASLLKVGALLLSWFWNDFLTVSIGLSPISVLEAVGVIAFIYLLYTGVRFGFENLSNLNIFNNQNERLKPGTLPQCKECRQANNPAYITNLKSMSVEDKEKLKEVIAKCCGLKNQNQTLTSNSVQLHILKKETSGKESFYN